MGVRRLSTVILVGALLLTTFGGAADAVIRAPGEAAITEVGPSGPMASANATGTYRSDDAWLLEQAKYVGFHKGVPGYEPLWRSINWDGSLPCAMEPDASAIPFLPYDGPGDAFTFHRVEAGRDLVLEAHAASIAQGYPDGTYRPTLPVIRGQMASLLMGAFADEQGPGTAVSRGTPPVTRGGTSTVEGVRRRHTRPGRADGGIRAWSFPSRSRRRCAARRCRPDARRRPGRRGDMGRADPPRKARGAVPDRVVRAAVRAAGGRRGR